MFCLFYFSLCVRGCVCVLARSRVVVSKHHSGDLRHKVVVSSLHSPDHGFESRRAAWFIIACSPEIFGHHDLSHEARFPGDTLDNKLAVLLTETQYIRRSPRYHAVTHLTQECGACSITALYSLLCA